MVLVTGGAGFIGSHTVSALTKNGYNVSVVDTLRSGSKKNLEGEVTFFESDVTDLKALEKVFEKVKPDLILHLAAQSNARYSFQDPRFDAVQNIIGSINALQCCRQFEVNKAVFASSVAVYGEPRHLPVSELHSINPICPYAISKYAAEMYITQYSSNFGLDCLILRYSNVFGPRQNPTSEAGVVSVFLEKMLRGEKPKINGSGKQTRDFVFVEDVAKANILALRKKSKSKLFNIGGGEETSVNEIFFKLKQLVGFKLEPVYGSEVPGEIKRIYVDSRLAEKELGWKPKISLNEGLQKTVDWNVDS